MAYRVEQLAARGGVSVDTVRFYQARGLLPLPRRQGRVALYDEAHARRLADIRRMQEDGLSLATIKRVLSAPLGAADAALAAAVGSGEAGTLSLEELARRAGVPVALLRAAEDAGVLVPRRSGGCAVYTTADVAAVAAGRVLLEHGLPLTEVLDLARRHQAAVRQIAEAAVELFDSHVRQPLRTAGLPEEEAARRLVDAFDALLPATVAVVSHQVRRTLLAVAEEHLERVGASLQPPVAVT